MVFAMLTMPVVLCPRCGNCPGELRPVASRVLQRNTFACPSCGLVWSVGERPAPSPRRLPLSRVSLPSPVDACPLCHTEGVTEVKVTSGGQASYYRCARCMHVWTVPMRSSA